jgi:hypothetical protein
MQHKNIEMSAQLKVLQVFIASPSDLVEERQEIKKVADSLNATFGKEVGCHIQLLGWEDRLPCYGRPQAKINEDVDKADLFFGFLYRRWGSDPGNHQYTSGFEEEYYRALERRGQSGLPEICLFFKNVDKETAEDPGDQLRKVQEFRNEVEKSKKILFRVFQNIADWKEQTRELLESHLLRLVAASLRKSEDDLPQAPTNYSGIESNQATSGENDNSSTSDALNQIVSIWGEALNSIRNGEMSGAHMQKSLDKLHVARIGLATSAITNRDIESEMPGAHLINLLYKNRKQTTLTTLEKISVFRANLVPETGCRTAWFWLKKTNIKFKRALVYTSCHDEHSDIRLAAFTLARRLGASFRKSSATGMPPIQILCNHEDIRTRRAALEYLAETGSEIDLPIMGGVLADTHNEVRIQAEATRESIRFRFNPSQQYESSIMPAPWISDDILKVIENNSSRIDLQLLMKSLTHPDVKVKIFAATELAKRSLIDKDTIRSLGDCDGIEKVYQQYYLNAISRGESCATEEIRENCKESIFSYLVHEKPRIKPDEIITKMFRGYDYEQLTGYLFPLSENSSIAYRILSDSHFEHFGAKVREDLGSHFAEMRESLEKNAQTSGSLFSSRGRSWRLESDSLDLSEFISAGLDSLQKFGDINDRELVLPYLNDKCDIIKRSAIAALRRVGLPHDSGTLRMMAEDANGITAETAAETALLLSPGEEGVASYFIKSAKPLLVKAAIRSILPCDPERVWMRIKDRLLDSDDDVRKLVCAFAIKKFSAKKLERILDNYLSKDSYYYNVVYMLDRALYAKPPLRKIFTDDMASHLD